MPVYVPACVCACLCVSECLKAWAQMGYGSWYCRLVNRISGAVRPYHNNPDAVYFYLLLSSIVLLEADLFGLLSTCMCWSSGLYLVPIGTIYTGGMHTNHCFDVAASG